MFNLLEESAPYFEHHLDTENREPRSDFRDDTSLGEIDASSSHPAKTLFKSSYNKNVCFNICQKTVKVIKKGLYEEKLN